MAKMKTPTAVRRKSKEPQFWFALQKGLAAHRRKPSFTAALIGLAALVALAVLMRLAGASP